VGVSRVIVTPGQDCPIVTPNNSRHGFSAALQHMNAAAQKINVFASVEPNGLELLASGGDAHRTMTQ
jgi:hypothetical protein